MRTFSRILLMVLAFFSVSLLGYYAYTISTDTMKFAFLGQENQQGDTLSLFVARPTLHTIRSSTEVFDRSALEAATTIDGVSWTNTVSGEANMVVSGEYMQIYAPNLKKDTSIVISSDVYNEKKSIGYRLPRDVVLTRTDTPKRFDIIPVGLPRDMVFDVEMYGYEDHTPEDIRWYTHHDRSRGCQIQNSWDSGVYELITPTEISYTEVGQRQLGRYKVFYDATIPYTCLFAGVGGDIFPVIDRAIDEFTINTGVVSVLSPEYDLQSEIEFRLSHDIFTDTGALYSDAYIDNRHKQKIEFLKLLQITPNIPLTEENIIMTPNRVSIVAQFQEGIDYKIGLNNIMDIYGRTQDVSMDFHPKSEPFLSLGLPSRRTMFRIGEPIDVKIYSVKTPKDVYTLKLCRISMEGYARTERMISEGRKEDIDTIYSMLDGGVDTSDCVKKDVMIQTGSSVSSIRLQDMYAGGTLVPGLYILAPREKDVALGFDKVVLPRVFSVIDSQITMKVDASGKMQFLVTDITTGAPRSDLSIKLNKNILRTYTEDWDSISGKYTKKYLPFTNRAFSTGTVLGKTSSDGVLETRKDAIIEDEYSPPYGLMYEWYDDYEGQYQSFVAVAEGGGHFGYVVSTWNDGITGWNFGLKDSDYSWYSRGEYLGYIHTDRRLYLPGEKVYVHAIIRQNQKTLTPPKGENFTVRVTNPMGVEIQNRVLQANEFGTIAFDFDLDKSATLGSYMVQMSNTSDDLLVIENGYTNFQVEVFKNPTFTADIKLKSSDIEGDTLLNLRKKQNDDPANPWYDTVYSSSFYIDAIVKARYYNGTQMKGIPFSYRIYRSPYYDASYWTDCFWGCYWQSSPEFYTEGTGTIDHDGMGVFRVPVDFTSFYNDYVYTAEVTIVDPLTGESVVTPATLLARLPLEYKAFDPYNPLLFKPKQKILKPGDSLSGDLALTYGGWDKSLQNKYKYELVQREYSRVLVDDLRIKDTAITSSSDTIILSGVVMSGSLTIPTNGLKPGEYHIRISPIQLNQEALPESSITDTLFYISGDFVDRNSQLRVIPEKTIYKYGEKARVFFTTPFTGGYLYITRERGGVLEYEYTKIEGNTLMREYTVDDSFYPNVYIGAIAYASGYTHGSRNYAVGYGEIVTDIADKKGTITITTDKDKYKNRDTVNLSLVFNDRQSRPLDGEIAIMVVDESLIRLLGNIDLDIVPKFFQKYPFTIKTAMTVIGMERNRFLSRKGSNGGSGDKGGAGQSLASRSLFRNTAYYNPTVRTDKNGTAKVSFSLPDNVTDYRIIAIGQTLGSHFAVSEKILPVRRDYTLETHVPYIAYPGDSFSATFSVFNATKKITPADITITFGSGTSAIIEKRSLIVQALSQSSESFTIPVSSLWNGDIPYTVVLSEKGVVLDSVTRTIRIPEIPLLESTIRKTGILTGSDISLPLVNDTSIDPRKSRIVMSISRGLLADPESSISSLISYPYGCIEQTISSTLPNAIAIKYASVLGIDIDTEQATNNLNEGISKILRMQTFGGWKYWESDYDNNPRVTPYVLRSLLMFREMGVQIPQASIDAGLQYLVDRIDWQNSEFSNDPDFLAEVFSTLAGYQHPRAISLIPRLDDYRKSNKLSRHGVLMYAVGLQSLGKLTDADMTQLESIMSQEDASSYWYWDRDADRSIYASLLMERGSMAQAYTLLEQLNRDINPKSYYVSTQTKIQFFVALIRHAQKYKSGKNISLSLKSDGFLAGLNLRDNQYSNTISVTKDIAGKELSISRKDSLSPIFYELLEYNVPKDIFTMAPKSSGGIEVKREFFLIDETRGVDSSGNWLIESQVPAKEFKKGSLYKVLITVTPPKSSGPMYYLTLEDFVPGGWRPIRGVFQTESRVTADNNASGYWNGWSHVEALQDRILITADTLWSSESKTYTYYIRPEYAGSYILPPVTAYYMYQPEIHAIGRYQKIQVIE